MTGATATPIPVRIVVGRPLAGVTLAVQEGRHGLLAPTVSRSDRMQFDFSLRLGRPLPDGRPNFLGDFAHSTRDARFVYVNAGKSAGQAASPWERRAKLMLDGVTAAQVEALRRDPSCVLQIRSTAAAATAVPPARACRWSEGDGRLSRV